MTRRYRVMEIRPGRFAVQKEGLLWGWNWVRSLMTECPIEFNSATEAAEKAREWMLEDSHQVREVKDYEW